MVSSALPNALSSRTAVCPGAALCSCPGSRHLGIWSFGVDCKHAITQKMPEILSVVCVQAVEAGQSRSGPLLRRPVRTQAVVDQSDMYTHVLSVFTEKKVGEARQPPLGLGFPRQ